MTAAAIATLFLLAAPQSPTQAAEQGGVLERVAPSIDASERTSILVLGTPHLTTVTGFEPAMLERLLAVLADWGPDVVCVEALPGRTIATMLAEEDTFGPVLDQFVGPALAKARLAQGHLEVGPFEAAAALRDAAETMQPAERALHALAAHELPTALLHWSVARATGDVEGLPDDLAAYLDRELASSNEIVTIGVALAGRLGLSRVDAVDDHLDKDDFLRIASPLMEALASSEELEEVAAAPVFVEARANLDAALAAGDLLPHYLHLGSPDYAVADVRAQWDVFLRTRLDSGLDRTRLALWDVRNLGIAAHVRRASARVPGGRVLVVIGAGHGPFLEALLSTALDVRIVRLAELVAADQPAGKR